jgi:hypothetical protein
MKKSILVDILFLLSLFHLSNSLKMRDGTIIGATQKIKLVDFEIYNDYEFTIVDSTNAKCVFSVKISNEDNFVEFKSDGSEPAKRNWKVANSGVTPVAVHKFKYSDGKWSYMKTGKQVDIGTLKSFEIVVKYDTTSAAANQCANIVLTDTKINGLSTATRILFPNVYKGDFFKTNLVPEQFIKGIMGVYHQFEKVVDGTNPCFTVNLKLGSDHFAIKSNGAYQKNGGTIQLKGQCDDALKCDRIESGIDFESEDEALKFRASVSNTYDKSKGEKQLYAQSEIEQFDNFEYYVEMIKTCSVSNPEMEILSTYHYSFPQKCPEKAPKTA